ncbi:protein of unknown function [Candidatus Nitrotoga arctica]|uniref:Uncharacterized protein n=1 Tax=Candidatus Nitrotoga arctica TaxID=453162 RepID=A0ABM8Z1W6_9PROT|nr:protein of unknown function [Candidatus Nitrotoga arctica]
MRFFTRNCVPKFLFLIKFFNKILEKLPAPEYFIQTVLSAGGMVANIAIYTTQEETSWL